MDGILNNFDSDQHVILAVDSNSNASDLIRRFSPRLGADSDNEVDFFVLRSLYDVESSIAVFDFLELII